MLRSCVVLLAFSLGCSRTPPEARGQNAAPLAAAQTPAENAAAASTAGQGTPTNSASATRVKGGEDTKASSAAQAAPLSAAATPAASSAAGPTTGPAASYRFPAAERVVAIGDLHGDLASTREALRVAGAIDEKDRWVGGKLVLVQVGDQLDRGDDEPEILRLLERLTEEAKAAGGAVHVLNGNHELMNAVGDLRYVTPDGFRDYANVPVPATARVPPQFPLEARGRFAAFAPGSELGRKLAERHTVLVVGDTLFAHAGVLPKHVRYGIERLNEEVRRYLRGETPTLPEVAASEDAPVWTRLYGGPNPGADACRELEQVLTALSVKRLVVGHTVQQAGITSACNDQVYRVDVGLSDYYGTNPTQVLELRGEAAKILGAGR